MHPSSHAVCHWCTRGASKSSYKKWKSSSNYKASEATPAAQEKCTPAWNDIQSLFASLAARGTTLATQAEAEAAASAAATAKKAAEEAALDSTGDTPMPSADEAGEESESAATDTGSEAERDSVAPLEASHKQLVASLGAEDHLTLALAARLARARAAVQCSKPLAQQIHIQSQKLQALAVKVEKTEGRVESCKQQVAQALSKLNEEETNLASQKAKMVEAKQEQLKLTKELASQDHGQASSDVDDATSASGSADAHPSPNWQDAFRGLESAGEQTKQDLEDWKALHAKLVEAARCKQVADEAASAAAAADAAKKRAAEHGDLEDPSKRPRQ